MYIKEGRHGGQVTTSGGATNTVRCVWVEETCEGEFLEREKAIQSMVRVVMTSGNVPGVRIMVACGKNPSEGNEATTDGVVWFPELRNGG